MSDDAQFILRAETNSWVETLQKLSDLAFHGITSMPEFVLVPLSYT